MRFSYFLYYYLVNKYFNKNAKFLQNKNYFNTPQKLEKNEYHKSISTRITACDNLNVIGVFKKAIKHPVKKPVFLLLIFSFCLFSYSIIAQPIACAGEDKTICQGDQVQLGCNSPVVGETYSWSPGSGLSCQKCKNPIASPSTSTEYTLIVTDSVGRTATDIVRVTINPDPMLNTDDFGGRDFKPCSGQLFTLEVWDASEFNGISITNYKIIWGDGTNDYNSSVPPTKLNHAYAPEENYTLTYEITGSNSCTSKTEYRVLNITNPAISTGIPENAIGCGPKELCFPITEFENNDTSTIYNINFGDGSDTLFHHPPPPEICHSYTKESCSNPGQFFEFVIEASNECDVGISRASPIKIFTKPIPELVVVPGCIDEMTQFVNNTIEGYNSACSNNTRYIFDFGDGSYDTVNTRNTINHAYAIKGNYEVTLIAENISCGSATFNTTVCVSPTPKATFNLEILNPCLPFSQVVTHNATDTLNNCGLVEFLWTIDQRDGYIFRSSGTTTSTVLNDTIDFYRAGSYKINLRYSNGCSISDSSQTIEINEQIELTEDNLIGLPDQACAPYSTTLTTDIIIADSTGYLWNISGGSVPVRFVPSNLQTPGGIELQPGNYTVELSVFNECGPSDTISKDILVVEKEIADAGLDTALCQSEPPVFLKGSPSGGIWSKVGLAPDAWPCLAPDGLFDPSCTDTSDHQLLYTIGTGNCEYQDTILITVIQPPNVEAGIDMVFCRNDAPYDLNLKSDASPTEGVWSGTGVENNIFNLSKVAFSSINITYMIIDSITGCSNFDSITITIPEIYAEAGDDLQICSNDAPLDLNLNTNLAPIGGTWSGEGISNNVFDPMMANSDEFFITYTTIESDSNSSCSAMDSIKVTITEVNVDSGSDLQLCLSGGIFDLNTNSGTIPIGGTWSGPGVTNSIFDPSKTGAGIFDLVYTVTVADQSLSCTNFDTIFVKVIDVIVDAGPDLEFCITDETFDLNSNVNLTPLGGVWNGLTIVNGIFDPQAAGVGVHQLDYTFTDQISRCIESDSLLAFVYDAPNVSAGRDFEICDYTNIEELKLGWPKGGIWTGPGITDSVKGNFNAFVSGTGSNVVSYTYTDQYGCYNADSIEISVCQDPIKAVQIPTAFTPNGDNLNDTFAPLLDEDSMIEEYWFQIATRSNEIVFESNDYQKRWDGNYLGNEIFGVCGYKVHVKFASGLTVDSVGEILVIR